MANSEVLDQTASRSGLIRVFTVLSPLSVQILRFLRYTSFKNLHNILREKYFVMVLKVKKILALFLELCNN